MKPTLRSPRIPLLFCSRMAALAAVLLVGQSLQAADVTWSSAGSSTPGGDGDWTGGSTWWNGSSAVTWTASDNATFSAAGNTTVNSDVTAASLTFGSSTDDISIIDGAGNLTLGSGGITATNTGDTAPRTFTIGESNLDFGSNQIWTVNNGGSTGTANLAVGSTISGGASTFTKNGNGTLTLSGAGNSWNGTTAIYNGTIELSGNLTTTGTVQTGWSTGGGVLNITGNLTRTGGNVRSFVIAGSANYNGTVNVSGSGVLNMGAGMLIGEDAGGHGVFNQSGGTVNTQGDVWMTGQTSTLNVSGGSFNMGSSWCRLGAGTTYGSNSTITVNGSGTITMGILSFGVASRNATAMTVNLGDGTVGGNLSISGMAYGAGGSAGPTTFNFNGGTLNVRNTLSMVTQATTVVKAGGAILDVDSGQTFTITNDLTTDGGGGGLTKEGTGTLVLSGNNTYTGATTVNAGTLSLGADQNLGVIAGAGELNLSTHTLTTNASSATTYSGVISGTGSLVKNGSSTLTLTGNNTYSGATTINNNSGTLLIDGSGQLGGGSHSGNISIGTNSLLTYNSTADQTLSGVISGAGAIHKYGASTLTLSGSNSRSGFFGMSNYSANLTAGTVKLEHNNALGTGDIVWENDGTIELATNGLTVANDNSIYARASATDGKRRYQLDLAGSNTGTLSGNFDVRMSGLVFDTGTDDTLTVSGNITNGAGGGGFEKTGDGTLVLSGSTLNYNGATLVSAGTLLVQGSLGASSAVTVESGATLGGTGTINGAATVNGNLRPGNSPGVLTFGGSLTLGSSSVVTMELNGTTRGTQYDGIDVTGALTYGGALTITVDSTFLGSTETFSLFTSGSQSGDLASVNLEGAYGTGGFANASGVWSLTDGSGNQWSFSQATGDLGFTAVPEPSTWALMASSAIVLLAVSRRRLRPRSKE